MKKIDRYIIDASCECGGYGDDVNSFEDKAGDWCKSDAVAKLESTIDELVEFLIDEAVNLSPPMRNYRGAAYYRVKDKLETLTGKTWEDIKKLQEEL